MMDECDTEVKAKVFRPRKPINRNTKLRLVFDPQARREFLTGFHKRKLQRKKKAQEELEKQLKEERKRLKQEAREAYKKLVVSHRPIPELEDLVSQNYDLENHSVSITELSASDLAKKNNWIGYNKVQYDDDKNDASEEEGRNDDNDDELPGMEIKAKKAKIEQRPEIKSEKDVKKIVKKQATKEVKKSKVFKLKNKLERQKNKKESRKKKNKQMKIQAKSKKRGGKKHGKRKK